MWICELPRFGISGYHAATNASLHRPRIFVFLGRMRCHWHAAAAYSMSYFIDLPTHLLDEFFEEWHAKDRSAKAKAKRKCEGKVQKVMRKHKRQVQHEMQRAMHERKR